MKQYSIKYTNAFENTLNQNGYRLIDYTNYGNTQVRSMQAWNVKADVEDLSTGEVITIDALIEDAGNIQAREIIAQAVIVHSYDGRISRKAKEWAKTRTITTEEEMINAGVYYDSYIHMAHLNQIAEAMMKREGGER